MNRKTSWRVAETSLALNINQVLTINPWVTIFFIDRQ